MPPETPIRLARVITRPAVGGAALHVALLVKHLKTPEFPTLLLAGRTEAREGNFYALHPEKFCKPRVIPSLVRQPSAGRDLRALRDLVRYFRAFAPDIVDTHLSKAGILGRLAARIAGVSNTIHTFHINIFEGYGWNPSEREIFLHLERFSARRTSRLICLSDELGAQLQLLGIGEASQWQTIHLGLELDKFSASDSQKHAARADLRAELGLESQTPLVGFIGRLAPVKNVKTLLESAAFVLESVPDAHFVVAGDGPSRARLETQTRNLNLAHRVHFLGLRADIAALNWALDCVVLPSFAEGTPISLIESLAAGANVVASDVGGVREIVQHEKSGLFINPDDVSGLSQSIARVLNRPDEAKIRAQFGCENVRRKFSIERLIEEHRALYRELWKSKN